MSSSPEISQSFWDALCIFPGVPINPVLIVKAVTYLC